MEIRVVGGDITQSDADAIVVNLFDGVRQPGGATGAVDSALDGAISGLIADGEITGKKGQMALIHTLGKLPAKRVLVVGLGKSQDFNEDIIRDVTAESCRYLRRTGVERAATIAHGTGIGGQEGEAAARAMAEGAILGLYTFRRHRTSNDDSKELKVLEIVEQDELKLPVFQRGIESGRIVAESAALARDLVNQPANRLTPTDMAEAAQQVAEEHGLEAEVLDRDQCEELGMGAFLGVARGSAEPPKLIVLRYRGDPDNPDNNLGLIGKSVTFDSGGLSLKGAEGMGRMKGDMAGGAAVIGAMKAIAQLGPRINVTAIAAATENLPSGTAVKPGDVLTTMSGKTVEVENTDAEGRLTLADAVTYARSLGLRRLVDVATLTGAMSVSLGSVRAGVFGNDQPLVNRVMRAGEAAGEKMWQLPMDDEYKELNKSTVADLKNTGGRGAGAITAAHFIGEFAGDTPWVHLDIAGVSMADKDSGPDVKGARGFPVRSLVRLAQDLARNRA